jgi:hypothetical protein
MHKSGTSLISETLQASGIEMVEDAPSARYDQGYHHERRRTGAINKNLLGARGWDSLDTIRRVGLAEADPGHVAEAAAFAAEMGRGNRDWGFKDPRTCLTYEVWRSVLPGHKLICVYRDLAEVTRHYLTRRQGAQVAKVLAAWFTYNKAMLAAYRSAAPDDRVLLHYGRFMSDESSIGALERVLGRKMTDRRDLKLRRRITQISTRLRLQALVHRLLTGQDVLGLQRDLDAEAGVIPVSPRSKRLMAVPTGLEGTRV